MSLCTQSAAARDRARVLVIDDDPNFRSLLLSQLRRDYLVSVANDGSEGYHKAVEYPPDVAVIDIQMPGWDGLKTIKAFRAHPALARVGIVVLTADASRDTVLAAIQTGAHEYVIKSGFSKEEFLQKLRRAQARSTAAPATEANSWSAHPRGDDPVISTDSESCDSDEGAKNLQAVIDSWE